MSTEFWNTIINILLIVSVLTAALGFTTAGRTPVWVYVPFVGVSAMSAIGMFSIWLLGFGS